MGEFPGGAMSHAEPQKQAVPDVTREQKVAFLAGYWRAFYRGDLLDHQVRPRAIADRLIAGLLNEWSIPVAEVVAAFEALDHALRSSQTWERLSR